MENGRGQFHVIQKCFKAFGGYMH